MTSIARVWAQPRPSTSDVLPSLKATRSQQRPLESRTQPDPNEIAARFFLGPPSTGFLPSSDKASPAFLHLWCFGSPPYEVVNCQLSQIMFLSGLTNPLSQQVDSVLAGSDKLPNLKGKFCTWSNNLYTQFAAAADRETHEALLKPSVDWKNAIADACNCESTTCFRSALSQVRRNSQSCVLSLARMEFSFTRQSPGHWVHLSERGACKNNFLITLDLEENLSWKFVQRRVPGKTGKAGCPTEESVTTFSSDNAGPARLLLDLPSVCTGEYLVVNDIVY